MNKGVLSKEVVLDEGLDVTVVRGGIGIRFNANGGIDVYGNAPVTLHARVTDVFPQLQVKAEPQVGDQMEDGTVFGGISPDTNKPMYVRPADEPLMMKWKQALDYAAWFESHGKPAGTFRVPTEGELNVLFENRAEIGGFNESSSSHACWYWSSTRGGGMTARNQGFSDGNRSWDYDNAVSSVRLVRS